MHVANATYPYLKILFHLNVLQFLIEKFIYASNWALLLKPVIEAVPAIFCVAILGCLARKTSQARATYSLRSSKVPLSYIDHQLHTDHINVLRPSSA